MVWVSLLARPYLYFFCSIPPTCESLQQPLPLGLPQRLAEYCDQPAPPQSFIIASPIRNSHLGGLMLFMVLFSLSVQLNSNLQALGV